MTYYSISAFINATVSILLGLFIIYNNIRSKLNRNLFFWCLAVFTWASFYFIWQIEEDSVKALLWTRLLMVGAIWAPLAYFKVITIFLEIENQQKKLTYLGYFLSTVFTLLLFTPLMVKNVEPAGGFLFWPKPGLAYTPFLVMFLGYTFYGLYLSIRAFKKSSPVKKAQIKFMVFGMIVGIIGGSTNYFLMYDIPIKPYGNIFASVYVFTIIYAIVRHHLLDIKLLILKSTFFILIIVLIGGLSTLNLLQILGDSNTNLNAKSNVFVSITSLIALISGIFVVGLGFFIFYRERRSILNRIFFVMSLAIGIWLIGTYRMLISQTDASAIFWDRFIYAGVVFIPALMYHFSRVFTKLGKQKISLIAGYSFSFIFLLLSRTDLFVSGLFYYRWGVHTQAKSFHHVFLLFFFVYLFLTLRIFYIYYRKGVLGSIQKIQAKYVFFAFSVLVIIGSTAYAPAYKIDIPPFSFFSGLIFTLILSYAIIRHRLLDIRLFVVRSILYTFTVIVVGMLFTLFVFTLGENILGSAFWGIIIGSVIISLGLEPLLHFLRRITDRYFFQEKYNYQKTIHELVRSMTRIIDLQNLLDTTTATIKNALKLERIAVILWNGADDLPVEIKQVGFDVPLDTHFSKNKALVKHLASTKIELVGGELKIEMERGRLKIPMAQAETIVREMRNLDIAVCFPIIANERLIGVLALGNKQSGDVFSNDDINLLNTFSMQASIAIMNAQLYQEVKDFNAKLQEKVDRATEHLRQSNEELRQANIRLKELDQAKSDFLSLASHQLRAPLSITKGYASMILEGTYGPCPPEMVGPLNMIFDGNERLVRFVNNLLDVSRMESGRLEYVFKDVNLSEMVQSVVKELKLAADKKKLNLELHIDSGQAIISADDEKLRQVVLNLIDNAIKYTKQGSVSVHLKKGKHNGSKQGFIFSVTDTGRGMNEADKASLFQKFSRGQGVSRIHTEGTGLGLYVASQIIQAHHGMIWADSPGKDKGSTFAFWVEGKG